MKQDPVSLERPIGFQVSSKQPELRPFTTLRLFAPGFCSELLYPEKLFAVVSISLVGISIRAQIKSHELSSGVAREPPPKKAAASSSAEQEIQGLDFVDHGETAYHYEEA